MKIEIEQVEVKIKFSEEKNLKAIIGLNFGDFVIRGFRVATSKYKNINGELLWITPPSYMDSARKYHPIFFMPDKELWLKLEAKIWEEYKKQQDEYYNKRFEL